MRCASTLCLILVSLITLSGCPSLWKTEASEKNLNADELYKSADESFQKKNYSQALDSFEKLKSAHPDFKDMPEVYLKIADSLYNEGSWDKAMARYSQFIELYPGHKSVPRAKYNIAMGTFNQIKQTDLDTRIVQKAAEAFKLIADDPDTGEWRKKAEEKYRECRQKLAAKEMYKARTYISMGNYNAARLVAKRVLDEYPKLGYDEEANQLISKIKNK
jgi:outer membrane protein assembly factor BamD